VALVYCGLAAATTAPYLTVAIVDDGGRLVDMRDISDDPAGFARLSGLLAERATTPGGGIAADSGAYLVTRLLAAAQRPLAIADERAVSDFAWRFADDASLGALASSAAERRAIGLARALLGGAIWASTQPTSPELESLRPVVAAYSAMSAGRQAAVTALREVLREVYPAALRAYPDPHEPIPLMIIEALPDPGFISQPPQTDAEVVDELARAGGYDPAAIQAAVASLRFAATELPHRVLGSVGANAVRQSIAALRACDAATSCLVGALTERLSSPAPVSGGRPGFASSTPGSGFAPVPAASMPAPMPMPVPAPAAAAYPPPPGGSGFVTVGGPGFAAAAAGAAAGYTAAATAGYAAAAGFGSDAPVSPGPRPGGGTYASGAYSGMSGPASYPPAPAAAAYPPAPATAAYPPPAPPMPPAPPTIPHQAAPPGYPPPSGYGPPPAYAPPSVPPHLAPTGPYTAQAQPPVPPQRAASEPTLAPPMPPMPTLAPPMPTMPAMPDPLSDPLPPREEAAPPLSWDAPTPSGRIRPPWLADDLREPESVQHVEREPLPRLSLADPLTDPLGPDPFAGMRYDPPAGVSPIDTGEYAMAEPRGAARHGGGDDGLLIFSQTAPPAWFADEAQLAQTERPNWGRLADDGWRAAEQAGRPATATATMSGLPVRVPQANLVPGAALPPPRSMRIVRDPQSIAAHTTGYFRGWRRGQEIGGFAIGQRDRGAWEFNREQRAREAREAADMRARRS
jgi:hypothetical protein